MEEETERRYDDDLRQISHRPYPPPSRPWRLRQRWRDLLFAHWPIAPARLAALLPPQLEPDLHDGQAWLGVVPFWMDQVRTRSYGGRSFGIPTTTTFNELNLRTYVRSRRTGKSGVYFYALDCSSPLSVLGARTLFHLPYYPAHMSRFPLADGLHYRSRRLLASLLAPHRSVEFEAAYAPKAPVLEQPDPLVRFLTERYSLFTLGFGKLLVGEIHHLAWPLQPARADFLCNDLPAAYGFALPQEAPLLHFSRELRVSLWSLREET